jgi:hypothetical protein
MRKLEVIVAKDSKKTGHLFCCDCATELNVVLSHNQVYRNPRYAPDWELMWHDFHAVKFIFPSVLEDVWDADIMKHVSCPYCSFVGKIIPNEGGLFDIYLIKNSLDQTGDTGYQCTCCEKTYATQKMMVRAGRDYICGDCAMFA